MADRQPGATSFTPQFNYAETDQGESVQLRNPATGEYHFLGEGSSEAIAEEAATRAAADNDLQNQIDMLVDLASIGDEFITEIIPFTYDGTNNVIPLSQLPDPDAKFTAILNNFPIIEKYSYDNQTVILDTSLLDIGIEYKLQITYRLLMVFLTLSTGSYLLTGDNMFYITNTLS